MHIDVPENIRELDRRAVRASMELVTGATAGRATNDPSADQSDAGPSADGPSTGPSSGGRLPADRLAAPTPCADWTLADLLAHMSVQHRGFAAAARGQGDDPASWTLPPVHSDPATDYLDASEQVLAAFAEVGLEQPMVLADFGGTAFPAAQAMGFHFLDYLVHAWDLAVSLGSTFEPDAELVEACWRIAAVIPTDPESRPAGGPFGPVVQVPDDATSWDRLLAHVGRTPTARAD